jgi:hypothetical protein
MPINVLVIYQRFYVALDTLELSKKDVTVVLCRGSNTGSIDVQAVGGLENYRHTIR